ncbi:AP2 domain protein [compost metagenome]
MHRQIMGLSFGDPNMVDHVNGNKLDNRRGNLRLCIKSENMHNRRAQKNNTSGFKGVSFDRRSGKFRAQIVVNKRHVHIGYYVNAEAAHAAYCVAAEKLHGQYANHG